MTHYKSNPRDIEFNLFEVLRVQDLFDSGIWSDLDTDTVRSMIEEVHRLAEGPVSESFAFADRNPPTFDASTHSVSIPEEFKKSFRAYWDAGWAYVALDPAVGGTPAPRAVSWALAEMVLSAQPAAFMCAAGPTSAHILYQLATEDQRKWATTMASRGWGATMVLTEPEAGSDVGSARTTAHPQPDGSWHIDGVKRFITSADSDDLFENIVHLVLARPEGGGPGTKGLSLFIVPKYHFDFDTEQLGERNGAFVTNLEDKMGLKASATCELTFGQHGTPAQGWLVGEVHNGIAQMFDMIEYARMFVGTKAIATLSTGYLNALDYAKQRIQGSDMATLGDKTAPRVPITRHPDVRRSLMLQKAYTEGLRALYLYTAAHQDNSLAAQVSGADADTARRVNDLLLPIVKGVGSERAYQYLTDSLQTFGGSGYLRDYPIEQYIRDAKIDTLYEGTTAIQAQDFFFRKIIRDKGVALTHLSGRIDEFIENENGRPDLNVGRARLKAALEDVQAMVGTLTGYLMAAQDSPEALYKIGLASVPFLMAVGDLLIGWQLLRQADLAAHALETTTSDSDRAFYEGKVATAHFFATTILPTLHTTRRLIESTETRIMELDEASL
ncbi:acyl-CoA dehydrogenase [Rhodococcoides yunnanense]|uniref:Acyl-CoA dehydrogenase n=1 Tax=Rhodococcoides yunnanense TaxID=278209 RepID=A0ABU4B8N6_9NOCA|nr:acyl-CoA dehydrogenase [Rhodococcus yunnanensis]MDV6260556.1 acyl-CoA dehydrogenase [Rhodococcus yunnanensis]